jgi:hypothetical protein
VRQLGLAPSNLGSPAGPGPQCNYCTPAHPGIMTTIAADLKTKTMVSDSRATFEDVGIWLPCKKMFRFDDGIVGISGDYLDEEKWLQWRRGGKKGKFPALSSEFFALFLSRDGLYVLDDKGGQMLVERGFHAVGSGAQSALAALILGHDVETAVRTACLIDSGSGGDVVTMTL